MGWLAWQPFFSLNRRASVQGICFMLTCVPAKILHMCPSLLSWEGAACLRATVPVAAVLRHVLPLRYVQ
jgi:hypothetical protein